MILRPKPVYNEPKTTKEGTDMEENKIGSFIRDRRLQLELTQQQLADKLGVTGKAVSKWERAVSYPDITLLRDLAAALEVSVTELLVGERDEAPPVPPEVENTVLDTVSYAETARKKNSGWKYVLFLVLTACCLQGALVCFIFFCISSGDWSWPLLAIKSIAFGWAVCYPLLRSERPVRNALIIASVFVYPLIWSFGAVRAWHLGVVVVSVAYAWAVYWAICRYRREKGIAAALILLLGGALHVSVNSMVGRGLEAAALVTGGTLLLDLVCLAGAYVMTARICRDSPARDGKSL